VTAGVAAGHPATAEVGLRTLAAGGTAADAAVAAMLASCASESVLTGIGGGGFATYYDAAARTVTCLDFFAAVPGLDNDRDPVPMTAIEVSFGEQPLDYLIGGASVGVPGVPAGAGEVHRRWGVLPWHQVVEPAITLAQSGTILPGAHARTLMAVAPALLPGAGARVYAPAGHLRRGGDLLRHPGLELMMVALANEGPAVFYTGWVAERIVDCVSVHGGVVTGKDLASYAVATTPVQSADLAGHRVFARRDLNNTVGTIAALSSSLTTMSRPDRAVAVADALRENGRQKLGDTTNVSVVDHDGNACVITTTLGIGSGLWPAGLGFNLNSMLGEGELITPELVPGGRMSSMMCPLVVSTRTAGSCWPPAPRGRRASGRR
jgi:gamma-glutamyltranspeptidase/glutathione hydrolase